MIAWLNPAALAGLAALALPILIHWLRQHRASRVPFPSLRFVHPSRTAAVRLRQVSDPWLLLVRLAVLALAALALAQPVVLTPPRLAAWNARTARAIVVDTSDSMTRDAAQSAAREVADAETASAFAARRFETTDLRAGLKQAAAWAATAPPAVREIVVISDFQSGALGRGDLSVIPPNVGVRPVQVGAATEERRFDGVTMLKPGQIVAHVNRTEIQLEPSTTHVIITPGTDAPTGLRLLTATEDEAAAQTLLRVVAGAGTPAPSATQPIAAAFRGASSPSPVRAIEADWMLATVVRLMDDPDLRAAAALATTPEGGEGSAAPWTIVSRDAQQRPIVRAAAVGRELIVDVAGAPDSYLAAAAVRGALLARQERSGYAEQEIVRLASGELARWTRAPGPVDSSIAVHADRTDARWFWVLALLMLGVETFMRRSRGIRAQEVQADAA